MPSAQVREFNHLIGAMNVANIEVMAFVTSYMASASELEVRAAWLLQVALLQKELAETGKQGQAVAAKWDDKLEAMMERMGELIHHCWRGLRAVEYVWEEMSGEFGGEDIARGIWRELVADIKERVVKVALAMDLTEDPEDLPEPDEEQLENLRAYVQRMRNVR